MLKHNHYINNRNFAYKNKSVVLAMQKALNDINSVFSYLSKKQNNKNIINDSIDKRSIKNFLLEILNFNSLVEEMLIRIAKQYLSKREIKEMTQLEMLHFIHKKSHTYSYKKEIQKTDFEGISILRILRNLIAHTIEPEKQMKQFLKNNSQESFFLLRKSLNIETSFLVREFNKIEYNQQFTQDKKTSVNPFKLKF